MESEQKQQELRLKGAPVSEGIAIGAPFILEVQDEDIPEFPIKISEVDAEIARYRNALFSSREDLARLKGDLVREGSIEVVSFIDTHIEMLQDPMMTDDMERNIRKSLKKPESVFRNVIKDYQHRFSEREDSFFGDRMVDVRDISNRVMSHLLEKPAMQISHIPDGSILFMKELSPSLAAAAPSRCVIGFVSEKGGGHSHAALIARSQGIPYITQISFEEIKKQLSPLLIIDGSTGELILNPCEDTLEEYQQRQNALKIRDAKYLKECEFPSETLDGYAVHLFANVGSPDDLDLFPDSFEGIGLFRTEYLLLPNQRNFPGEEEQYRAYRSLVEKAKGKPTVFRVFDLGGDKTGGFKMEKEDNPVLGIRGIRFLLKHPSLFVEQLRAIFRASVGADVRILLPLISDVSELICAKEIISTIRNSLQLPPLPIGCMIEVPSAVMTLETLARLSDFLSIGTNDLVQYTLGVDRGNCNMSDLLYPAHPSILRMLKMIATLCTRVNKPVTICGEIASNPLFAPLLLGLGFNGFSCPPRAIPAIKETVRSWTIVDAYHLAERALKLEDPEEVLQLIKSTLH